MTTRFRFCRGTSQTWRWRCALHVAATACAVVAASRPLVAQDSEAAVEESSCVRCHGEAELWEDDRANLHVTIEHLENDIHWKKGIHCHDCHGGDAESLDFRQAHSPDAGYRALASPQDIPPFCGHCHSNVDYMKRFQPSPKTNQLEDYWTSGHGQRLKEIGDGKAATCVSCHGGHGMRAVDDLDSPVYPTRVAKTCAGCHSDAQRMAGIEYHGSPIGHNQYALWKTSVHAAALLEGGDLSAATCNDCHGNHGSVPPDAESVAFACSTCHAKIGELFAQTQMKHRFEETQLPGCATCHGEHAIHHPTDEMLGMGEGAVCANCHQQGQHGATLAGATEARAMRKSLETLKQRIAEAERRLDQAERLGMEVSEPRYRLREARESLVNSRALIHSFAPEPMQSTLEEGLQVASEVKASADDALAQYRFRRVWLGLSLVPILIVVVLLVRYIRSVPLPEGGQTEAAHQ